MPKRFRHSGEVGLVVKRAVDMEVELNIVVLDGFRSMEGNFKTSNEHESNNTYSNNFKKFI